MYKFKLVQHFVVFCSNGNDKFSGLNSRGQLEWGSFFLPRDERHPVGTRDVCFGQKLVHYDNYCVKTRLYRYLALGIVRSRTLDNITSNTFQ